MQLRIASCRPLPEPDPDEDILLSALHEAGIKAKICAWNDPAEDWDKAVPTIIRSTWNYIHSIPEFSLWLSRVQLAAPLWNSENIVRANLHKSYLLRLADAGVSVTPTVLLERNSTIPLSTVLHEKNWRDIVLKPAVGAGSFATYRIKTPLSADSEGLFSNLICERDLLVQPYLQSVEQYGERALVWIAGEFTHAVRKTARFSGEVEHVSEAVEISPAERSLGEAALEWFGSELLYGRVDVALNEVGLPVVMEVELIEPSLFLAQKPRAIQRLVTALVKQLRA